jgi:hypothetical protein
MGIKDENRGVRLPFISIAIRIFPFRSALLIAMGVRYNSRVISVPDGSLIFERGTERFTEMILSRISFRKRNDGGDAR